ncbi:MAG: hypothetical protein EBV72_14975 [Betaproteobacteria bacterium]|jgi:hypothetical protein|nr:hypothetical protein [Betaproteobacteria bacterium]
MDVLPSDFLPAFADIRPLSNPRINLDLIAIENKTKRNPLVGSMLLGAYVCEIDQAHCQLDSYGRALSRPNAYALLSPLA